MNTRLQIALLGIAALCLAAPIQASLVTQVSVGVLQYYNQTSTAAPTSATGYTLLASYTETPGAVTSATLTYPGPGSPLTLPTGGTTPQYISPTVPTLSAFQTDYPFGAYLFSLSDGATVLNETVNYTQNLYPTGIPAFTAASYTAFQGMNALSALTVNFNTFTPNGGLPVSGNSQTQFFIFQGSNTIFASALLPDTATSTVLPANLLVPGEQYTAALRFNDNFATQDASTGVNLAQGFNEETYFGFTTASAPEPSTLLLLGLSAAYLAGLHRWRTAR